MRWRVRPQDAALFPLFVVWAAAASAQPSPIASQTPAAAVGAPAIGEALPAEGSGEPARVQMSWDATFASHYAFQGVDYSDGHAVAQPELELGYGSFTAAVWFSQDLELGEVGELDLTAEYAGSIRSWDVALGCARLTYPAAAGGETAHELTFAVERPGRVTAQADVHWDFDSGRGVYSTVGLSSEVPVPVQPVNLAVEVHHWQSYYGMSGIPSMGITLGVERPFAGVTWSPSVSRFVSWENAGFRGPGRVPASWVVRLGVAQAF